MGSITFCVTEKTLLEFQSYLQERESAASTIAKYMRDMRCFIRFIGQEESVGKEKLLQYKEWLMENYAASSANSMLAALNQFLVFCGAGRLRLKRIRVQQTVVLRLEKELKKEEFQKLVHTARNEGRPQLAMMMETMCATGIRVSELKYFRLESIRTGMIRIWNKGKYRIVLIPRLLKEKLLIYAGKNGIKSGILFRTRTGREKNRSNIWKEMKKIAEKAGVSMQKVFPHNLRHLFARTFYRETKNLLILADILGHSSLEVTRIYASEGVQEWQRNMERLKLLETIT